MKRFVLNKIKIAKFAELQKINGKGATPTYTNTVDDEETCTASNVLSCPTNTSLNGHDTTNP